MKRLSVVRDWELNELTELTMLSAFVGPSPLAACSPCSYLDRTCFLTSEPASRSCSTNLLGPTSTGSYDTDLSPCERATAHSRIHTTPGESGRASHHGVSSRGGSTCECRDGSHTRDSTASR